MCLDGDIALLQIAYPSGEWGLHRSVGDGLTG